VLARETVDGLAMDWHVQFREDGATLISHFGTPKQAIQAACLLLDKGCDVFGIGTGALTDSIEQSDIARIYKLWSCARPGG